MESLKNAKCVLESPWKVLEVFVQKGYEPCIICIVAKLFCLFSTDEEGDDDDDDEGEEDEEDEEGEGETYFTV